MYKWKIYTTNEELGNANEKFHYIYVKYTIQKR